VAWCTGGAQGYFEAAIAAGADAFLTGEISEPQAHLARETGVAFLACGHHATERFGAGRPWPPMAWSTSSRQQFGPASTASSTSTTRHERPFAGDHGRCRRHRARDHRARLSQGALAGCVVLATRVLRRAGAR
jgi:hypothetical protein